MKIEHRKLNIRSSENLKSLNSLKIGKIKIVKRIIF
jgi:hypothetical protein